MGVLVFGCGCVRRIWISRFLFFLHCGTRGSFVAHVVWFFCAESSVLRLLSGA